MIASFHLVHYRRPRFHESRLQQIPGLTFWRPFSTGPDFTALKPGFNRLALAAPEFKRWAFFGIWQDENALKLFLENSSIAREWEERAAETWHVGLMPIRSSGTWRGENPLEGLDLSEVPKCPVAVLTRADIRLSKLHVFWLWGTHPAVSDVRQASGLVAGLAMTERPLVEAATFTVWRSLDDVINFAYKRTAHQGLIARNQREQVFKAFFATYFFPFQSAGTWRGKDPASVAREQRGTPA
jgi:hypothetical protein